jgi:hypothetical protein
MATKTTHGGYRKGAGRKPAPTKKVAKLVYLKPQQWEQLYRFGETPGQGIAALLAHYAAYTIMMGEFAALPSLSPLSPIETLDKVRRDSNTILRFTLPRH